MKVIYFYIKVIYMRLLLRLLRHCLPCFGHKVRGFREKVVVFGKEVRVIEHKVRWTQKLLAGNAIVRLSLSKPFGKLRLTAPLFLFKCPLISQKVPAALLLVA
jgi:hypothetical protein